MGIPIIGCDCSICTSDNPSNKRLRPSALITINDRNFLIDAGPDLREQALRYQLKMLHGLLLTHAHNDHVAGLDELRMFFKYHGAPIPLLMSPETYHDVAARFAYIFKDSQQVSGLVPQFDIKLLAESQGEVEFADLKIGYVSYKQAGMRVNGFRFGDLAYISDIHDYSDAIFQQLTGVKTLVVTAIRFTPSPIHFSIDEAIAFSQKVGAEHTWITHIGHELEHEKANAYLPPHIRLAYDGLKIEFNYA